MGKEVGIIDKDGCWIEYEGKRYGPCKTLIDALRSRRKTKKKDDKALGDTSDG
jgi:hypothetical protein